MHAKQDFHPNTDAKKSSRKNLWSLSNIFCIAWMSLFFVFLLTHFGVFGVTA